MGQRFNPGDSTRTLAPGAGVRPTAVAGLFYPAVARELEETVASLLAGPDAPRPAPKALIVPHAGYVYSGAVAARAFRALGPVAGMVRRIVLVGWCSARRSVYRWLGPARLMAVETATARNTAPAAIKNASIGLLLFPLVGTRNRGRRGMH